MTSMASTLSWSSAKAMRVDSSESSPARARSCGSVAKAEGAAHRQLSQPLQDRFRPAVIAARSDPEMKRQPV
jgi:hypothetical protein